MLLIAEELAVFLHVKNVLIGVNALLIDEIKTYKVVTNLVGGVGEHDNNLLRASCNTLKADCKAVTAEDGEDYANGSLGELCTHVSCNIVNRCVVALGTSHDSLCHSDNISVSDFKGGVCRRIKNRLGHDLNKIIAASDNRRSYTSGYRSDSTTHRLFLLEFMHKCKVRFTKLVIFDRFFNRLERLIADAMLNLAGVV